MDRNAGPFVLCENWVASLKNSGNWSPCTCALLYAWLLQGVGVWAATLCWDKNIVNPPLVFVAIWCGIGTGAALWVGRISMNQINLHSPIDRTVIRSTEQLNIWRAPSTCLLVWNKKDNQRMQQAIAIKLIYLSPIWNVHSKRGQINDTLKYELAV